MMPIFQNYYFKMSKLILFFILITILTLTTFSNLVDGDWGSLENSLANLSTFFYESLWPPNWKVIEPQAYPVCTEIPLLDFRCSTAWIGMTETIKIAFVSTIFGMILSMPISLLAARNLNPIWISYPARIILAAFRSLPSIIWAILFVILIGFGPVAGTLAMTFYTVGYLGKLQYESIEGISREPLDAADVMGLNKIEKAYTVVIPESANNLISQLIFMFEYNVRHGTVIGIVGAGGIGYYINLYLKFLQYDKVIAYLIIIFITVVIIDLISIYARSFFTEKENLKRPTWKEIFIPEFLFSKYKKE
ncbi:MAG: phosphonate ABC transporter, permease protein PhnE [Euryarchaeota archaeon]|nr:phosphonate ABC transporter, permease protein PhnE [Euryarchaeota archaeon]|tara:strand:- start:11940 stop:12857 length:918 start_codon:yes stop_codon:yes gene_type:complete